MEFYRLQKDEEIKNTNLCPPATLSKFILILNKMSYIIRSKIIQNC